MGSAKAQVLVVGAGPTGLTMAAELARHQIAFRLIDKAPAACPHARAGSIHSKTLEIFESLGVIGPFLAEGQKILRAITYIAPCREIARTDYDGIESQFNFTLSIEQSKTEQYLTELLATGGHSVERSVELVEFHEEGDQVKVRLEHPGGRQEELSVDFLVGCDGAHSKVRHSLEGTFEGVTFPQDFLIADVILECSLARDAAHYFLGEEGSLAIFPLPRGRSCIAMDCTTTDLSNPEEILAELQALMDSRAVSDSRVSDVRWRSRFRVNARQVDLYRRGRVFLAGDAAHIQSPFGGKGMNTGIQDAHNLGWKLAMVLQGFAGPAVLDSYHPERQHAGRETVDYSNRVQAGLVEANYQPGRTGAIQASFKKPASTYSGRQRMVNTMAELSLTYKGKGPLIDEAHGAPRSWTDEPTRHRDQHFWRNFSEAPGAGDRAPDVSVFDLTGREHRVYEILRGTQHHLFLVEGGRQSSQALEHLRELAGELQRRLAGVAQVHLISHAPVDVAAPVLNWLDSKGHFHLRYGAKEDSLYWIRPDFYIGYRSQPAEAAPFLEYLERFSVMPA